MAFKPFGDTEPESITYNGNEVKVVNYNGTYVWGKPYTSSLTKTTGSGASAGVGYIIRKTSQYEHAPTSLTTQIPIIGTKNIYYGDGIAVYFNCPSGSKITAATVTNNGATVSITTIDNQNRSTGFFTVNGNISCSMTTASDGPTWHTLWEGSVGTIIKAINKTYTATIPNLNALSTDWLYRITTYGMKPQSVGDDAVGATVVISQDDLPYRYRINLANIYKYTAIEATASAGSLYYDQVEVTIDSGTATGEFYVTKVEAYY